MFTKIFVSFAALLVAVNAGAAPVTYSYFHEAPQIGTQSESTFRGFGGQSSISKHSKAVDSPFSRIRKSEVRVTNDVAQFASPTYSTYAQQPLGAQLAYAQSPLVYNQGTPAAYAQHAPAISYQQQTQLSSVAQGVQQVAYAQHAKHALAARQPILYHQSAPAAAPAVAYSAKSVSGAHAGLTAYEPQAQLLYTSQINPQQLYTSQIEQQQLYSSQIQPQEVYSRIPDATYAAAPAVSGAPYGYQVAATGPVAYQQQTYAAGPAFAAKVHHTAAQYASNEPVYEQKQLYAEAPTYSAAPQSIYHQPASLAKVYQSPASAYRVSTGADYGASAGSAAYQQKYLQALARASPPVAKLRNAAAPTSLQSSAAYPKLQPTGPITYSAQKNNQLQLGVDYSPVSPAVASYNFNGYGVNYSY